MKNSKFKIGDTIYIPKNDPKASTIWIIEKIKKNKVSLYHPLKNCISANIEEIEDSPF